MPLITDQKKVDAGTLEKRRHKRALWKATKIALFLWIPIGIYRWYQKRKGGEEQKEGTFYSKVGGNQQDSSAVTAAGNVKDEKTSYGGYGEGGSGRSDDVEAKYEPMAYSGAGGVAAGTVGVAEPVGPYGYSDTGATTYTPGVVGQDVVQAAPPPPLYYPGEGAAGEYYNRR